MSPPALKPALHMAAHDPIPIEEFEYVVLVLAVVCPQSTAPNSSPTLGPVVGGWLIAPSLGLKPRRTFQWPRGNLISWC